MIDGVRPPGGSPQSKGGDFIPADGPSGGAFDLDKLKRMRDDCDKAGVTIEGFRMDSGYIVMKPGPERERKLDQTIENIRKTSLVGVGLISQHWTMIPIRRNGTQPGRGDSTYATFTLETGRVPGGAREDSPDPHACSPGRTEPLCRSLPR